jgi:hypothetical protein
MGLIPSLCLIGKAATGRGGVAVWLRITPTSQLRVCAADRQLGFDLNRYVERQPRHAHRGARMGADIGAEHFQDQIAEPVDDRWKPVEPGPGVDHAEHPQPLGDPIEITLRLFQAGDDRQTGQPSGRVTLLLDPIRAHPA